MSEVDRSTLERLLGAEPPAEPQHWPPPAVDRPDRVLIVGQPRSGTTFLARALARTSDVGYSEEPDNGDKSVSACRGIHGMGLHPALRADASCEQFQRCLEGAFEVASRLDRVRSRVAERLSAPYETTRRVMTADADRRPLPARLRWAMAIAPWRVGPPSTPVRLVKTVHVALSLDWVRANFDARMIATRRHPLDILASWISLGFSPLAGGWSMLSVGDVNEIAERFGAPPPPLHVEDRSSVTTRAWVVGLLATGVEQAIADHPDVVVADHELICRDPAGELRHIARQAGLQWTDGAERFVRESDRPGAGYQLQRVASSVPGSWRQRLSPEQIAEAVAVLRQFPWAARYDGIGA